MSAGTVGTRMAVTAPDWLSAHGGELRASADGKSWLVYFGPTLMYSLAVTPVQGKYGCRVTQTNNGKRLDRGGSWPTVEDAARGGLEDLRVALGW